MKPSVDTLIQEAQLAEQEGRYADARVLYERALYSLKRAQDGQLATSILRWVARTHQLDSDDEAALDMLHQLRKLGVRIALDDFGTGYSSLSYLQRFPFDKIKIDRSFIRDIAGPGASSSIVQAVVNIAAASDMTTTAEGVETEQQRNLLHILGCTEMQGYLFSPAIPAAEVKRLLASHRGTAMSAA